MSDKLLILPAIRLEPERDGDAWIVITPNGHGMALRGSPRRAARKEVARPAMGAAMTVPLTSVFSGQVCIGFILSRQ